MKHTLAALIFSLTATFAHANEKILRQVDAFLGNPSFDAAFSCGDKVTHRNTVKWEDYHYVDLYQSEVTACGEVAQITEYYDDENSVSTIDRAAYEAAKGNPLRLYSGERGVKIQQENFSWTQAKKINLNYLGKRRQGMRVTGVGEICIETSEKADCFAAQLSLVIVRGLPFLATMGQIEVNSPELALKLDSSVIDFVRTR